MVRDALKGEDQTLGKNGIEGFLRSGYLHRQVPDWPLRTSYNYRILVRLARLQREFRDEGLQGRVVVEMPLYLGGHLWLVWPDIAEEDAQASKRDFFGRGPTMDDRAAPQRGPCSYAMSEAFSLRCFTNSATDCSR